MMNANIRRLPSVLGLSLAALVLASNTACSGDLDRPDDLAPPSPNTQTRSDQLRVIARDQLGVLAANDFLNNTGAWDTDFESLIDDGEVVLTRRTYGENARYGELRAVVSIPQTGGASMRTAEDIQGRIKGISVTLESEEHQKDGTTFAVSFNDGFDWWTG